MDLLARFLPQDRRQALGTGTPLPDRTSGAALLADLSGYTALSEALAGALGPQRGAEELTGLLNRVYAALIREVERYGGSVLGFAGDAITCWFDDAGAAEAGAARAASAALALQAAMAPFATVAVPGGAAIALALKVAVTAGPARRFVVGDPARGLLDVLAGPTVARVGELEEEAARGEVLLDEAAATALHGVGPSGAWRTDAASATRLLVLTALAAPVAGGPAPDPAPLTAAQVQPWLLPPVWERLTHEAGTFLPELRPAVALFLRFGGIDYARPTAGTRLDTYIHWVQGVLARYEAHILQLTVGDKGSYLYAAFGAPRAHTDEAARAVAAALELRTPPPPCAYIRSVQIGIASGPVWAGPYGGPSRATYGVLGPMVNLAARLMQAAAPGGVLVTRAVQAAAGAHFAWERLPALTVKGMREPVPVWGLVAAERARLGLLEPAYHTPLLGRAAEQALLAAQAAAAARGAGQIVAVTGEAGVGKSRLVAEAVRQARAAGFVAYGGAAQSYGAQTAYLAWQSVWRAFFDLDPDSTPDELALVLEDHLAAIDAALVERQPLLGAAVGLALPDTALTAGMDAKLRKESLEALLIDCLTARAGDTPVLLVLEDCHWLDPLSHDLVEALGRAVATLPVLLVLAYRPPDLERGPAPRVTTLPHFTELRLGPLGPEEAAQLVASQVGGAGPLPVELVAELVARAEGNPFYLEELLHYLHERDLDLRAPGSLAQVEWPASLQSLLLARIDQLTEEQRAVLKVASVIGRVFQRVQLWGVYPALGTEAVVAAALADLDRLGLTPLDVPAPDWTHLFKHIATQEVTYSSLPRALRQRLHAQFAAWLEAGHAVAQAPPLDLLAYHYGQSANQAKAREYLQKAGDAAAAAYNNAAAVAYYERVLELLPAQEQAPVLLAVGDGLERLGAWEAAAARYQQILQETGGDGSSNCGAHAQLGLGRVRRYQGQYSEARQWLEEARGAYQAAGDSSGESRALTELGRVHYHQGAYPAAGTVLEEAAKRAERGGDRPVQAQALGYLGAVVWQQGDYPAAAAYGAASLALYRDLDDRPGIAWTRNVQGTLALQQGDHSAARHAFEESLALHRRLGNRLGAASNLDNLGNLALDQGAYEAARMYWEQALRLCRDLSSRSGLAANLGNLGQLALRLGDRAEAGRYILEDLRLCRTLGAPSLVALALTRAAALLTPDPRAARLLSTTSELREKLGLQFDRLEQQFYEETCAIVRNALGGEAGAEKQALTWEAAVDEALVALGAAAVPAE